MCCSFTPLPLQHCRQCMNWTDPLDLITRHAWLSAPSIWLTEQTRRLQALPNVHFHHLQHCIFGGATKKPTRFMTVNMKTELNEELKKVERPRKPTGCLIGKHPDGTWRTSHAKEYPKAMSAGIAAAMIRLACKHRSILTQVDPEEAIALFAPFSPQLLHTVEASGVDFVD